MATTRAGANRVFRPCNEFRGRYVVMKGSAGSGKSQDTAQTYIIRLMADKGRNLLCVRKSDVTNRDSTFAELVAAIYRLGLSDYWTVGLSPLSLTCYNGNRVIFRGTNDDKQREKLKSITFSSGKLTDVWIEEATELTQEDFEIIDDRLRGELPPGQFYQIRLTFNPVSSAHWIKRVFFDRDDPEVLKHHSTYLDNRFIDEGYKRRMERRREVDPEGYRVYGLGEWGEVGGLVLQPFEVQAFERNPARFDRMVLAQDFGFNHANAILLVGFKDENLYICKELYVYEKDTAEIIELANSMKLPKDVPMWCDSAEPDRIKMWQKAGYKARGVKKEPNSVRAQIDYLRQRRILCHPSCVHTLEEAGQWKYKKDEKTGKYTDEPVPFHDDAMAALRYSIEDCRRVPVSVRLFGGI